MSKALIVAGLADVAFAEEVRRTTRGLDIEIVRSLPTGEQRTVLLVWSAAAPATAADVPTLIDLWSQGRLVIARRDDTALPLGLGDLDTVPADAPARETALKLLHAALGPGEGAPVLLQPAPVGSPPPAFEPAPAAMARRARPWPLVVATVVAALVIAGGLMMWRQQAALPPVESFAGSEEVAKRRELEAAQAAARQAASQQARSSSNESERRAAAAHAAERAAAERNARESSSPPPPPSAQPADDTRIVDLERQIAELKSRLESGVADGSRAKASEMPAWVPWAAGAGVVALTAVLLVMVRRRPRAVAEAVGPAAIPAAMPPPAEAGDSLFVSYAHRDRPRVDPLVLEIEGMGRAVWIDRTGMTGGPGWAGQIARAIKSSRAVVLMASPSAYASDQVVRELYLAMGSKKVIVPIELEPADLPDELAYILAPFQRHALVGDPRTMLLRALDKV